MENTNYCEKGGAPKNPSPVIMQEKRKYEETNLFDKLKVIDDLHNGMLIRDVAQKYGASIGTVSNWKKRKENFMERALNNEPVLKKKLTVSSSMLDERIYNWFAAVRSNNITIFGPIIQEKAKKVAEILNLRTFKASNGWLESFRKRHNIFLLVLHLDRVSALINKS